MSSNKSNHSNQADNSTLDLFSEAMQDFEAQREHEYSMEYSSQPDLQTNSHQAIPAEPAESIKTISTDTSADDLSWLQDYFGVQADAQLEDGHARFSGVNPQQSYIVQAPAGSGKTSLLSQRFLALLSQVEYPEQIVAMTFTKKAAAEMRERIIEALQFGLQAYPENAILMHQNTWKLANKALQRDQEKGWNLIQNANRLRIKTIDGMNSYLVGQMLLLSKVGGQPQLLQEATPAYQ